MKRILWGLVCVIAVGCMRAPEPSAPAAVVEAGVSLQIRGGEALTEPGGFADPAWSTDGEQVSFTGVGFDGLYVVAARGGAVETLVEPGGVSGFRHHWDGERIVCPGRGSRPSVEVVPASGTVSEIDAEPGPVFELYRGDVYRGEVSDETRLTQGEDKFFDPVVSPDGKRVALVGLATGIHVLDLDSRLAVAHAGPGTHPAWTPDSRWVLFERTGDDGHELTAGDLWAVQSSTGEVVQLTATDDFIEVHPNVSPDGSRVAYSRDDAIWVAQLVEGGTP